MERQLENFNNNVIDIENDIDEEYTKVQYHYAMRLKTEQDALKEIQTENQKMKAEFDSLVRQIENNKGELNNMLAEEKKSQGIIKSLEKDIIGLKREVTNIQFKSHYFRFKNEMILYWIRKREFLIFARRIKNLKNSSLCLTTKSSSLKSKLSPKKRIS